MKLLTVYKLTVLSFVLGGVSVTLFALAVSTDAWLTTREKFSASMMEENQPHDMTYWILVWTGLWRFCMMTESLGKRGREEGAGKKGQGRRGREEGAGKKGQGRRGREEGAGKKGQGRRGREEGAGKKGQGRRGREEGAGKKGQGRRGREEGAGKKGQGRRGREEGAGKKGQGRRGREEGAGKKGQGRRGREEGAGKKGQGRRGREEGAGKKGQGRRGREEGAGKKGQGRRGREEGAGKKGQGRRGREEGAGKKGQGRRGREEGAGKKGQGRRGREEGAGKKGQGRRGREEGAGKKGQGRRGREEGEPDSVSCMAVSYEVQGTGRGENNALTSFTIIAVARKSVVLPVSSLILSVVAVTFTVVGNIRKDAKTLVGGVFFILSGLSLAVGMILYISAINDEVGYRVSTSKNEGEFSYAYGWSFFTAGFGFLASEMAAVVTVTLFMKRNAKFEDMARIIPGLEDKVLPDKPHHEYAFSAVPMDDQQFLCHSEQRRGKFALCGGMRNLSVTA
ncbi:Voltage-dependent calcium channel gamma-5 subunit [Biomphalaria glabrata]|nr:voltage-dependent calcium channel gamma-7 subunit-like; partial [Biomphalaria glabrata]